MIPYPQPDEYFAYYGNYVQKVPQDADVLALLGTQPAKLRTLVQGVRDDQAGQRPAPTEWSIKEVLGHLCDGERILAYRAVCMARGDTTPLPGFEQDDYVAGTDFNRRSLASLVDEFDFQRQANVLCVRAFTPTELERRGTASGYPFSVRALIYVMAGHVTHHLISLKAVHGLK